MENLISKEREALQNAQNLASIRAAQNQHAAQLNTLVTTSRGAGITQTFMRNIDTPDISVTAQYHRTSQSTNNLPAPSMVQNQNVPDSPTLSDKIAMQSEMTNYVVQGQQQQLVMQQQQQQQLQRSSTKKMQQLSGSSSISTSTNSGIMMMPGGSMQSLVLPSPGPTVRQRISNWMRSADSGTGGRSGGNAKI